MNFQNVVCICRWAGRNNRGKISVHVDFAAELDVRNFCHSNLVANSYVYKLSAVVMHHGRGFGSGHYSAYCWNDDAGGSLIVLWFITRRIVMLPIVETLMLSLFLIS